LLNVSSGLGKDVLLLTGFSGEEAMSRLFRYNLDLLSEKDNIAARDIVGMPVTWSVQPRRDRARYFHGHVVRFVAGGKSPRGLRSYRAEVAPWLWFLTRTSDCRIFQGLSTPDIIQTLFKQFGFSQFVFSLRNSYSPREYCVQYRETAFGFISRLMEQEGIFYFFRHEEGKHTLVLGDHVSVYEECPESPVELGAEDAAFGRLKSWEHGYEFRSGQWTETDFNFETPSTSLLKSSPTLIGLPSAAKYELFDYPGLYKTPPAGAAATKVRMEEEEVHLDVAAGAGTYCTFALGTKLQLIKHECEAENRAYVLTSIRHSASETSYGASGAGGSYENSFTCIPASVVFRPERVTPRPVLASVQTAIVVGPPGEEIFCDKYGRVKVQLHWDRRGKKNAESSCWLRVCQLAAGKGFGALHIPRVGQEVVVAFLEGDPDRPLVLGGVYNAGNMPPYPLPALRSYTGMRHQSVGGVPGNASEIRFETGLGQESLFVHAETDLHQHAENDSHLHVGNDHRCLVGNDHVQQIGKDHHHQVAHNYTLTVGSGFSWDMGSAARAGASGAAAQGSGMGGGDDAPAPSYFAPEGEAPTPHHIDDKDWYSATRSRAPQDLGIGTFQINASNIMTIAKYSDNKLVLGLEGLFVVGLNITMTAPTNMEFNAGEKLEWSMDHTDLSDDHCFLAKDTVKMASNAGVILIGGGSTITMTAASIILQCGAASLTISPAGIVAKPMVTAG
jgi:type VI secretion system secreted protein VgrG